MRRFRDEEEYFEELSSLQECFDEEVEDMMREAEEKDGFGAWVEGRLPKKSGLYCVRGTATLNGEAVEFEDMAECLFRAVNVRVGSDNYDIEGYWDTTCGMDLDGYRDIAVTAWKQAD